MVSVQVSATVVTFKNLFASPQLILLIILCENTHLPVSRSVSQAVNRLSHTRWCVPPRG